MMSGKLNTSEACQYLGITRKTYQTYIRQGKIQAAMEGIKWMVERAELDRFLAAQSGTPAVSSVRRDEVVNNLMALEHIRPEHRGLVEDYAQECVTLDNAVNSKDRSDALARKLKLAEALLLTPKEMSKLKEASAEIEVGRNINQIFVLAIEQDAELGPVFSARREDLSNAVASLTRDFTDSGLEFEEWWKGKC